MQDKITIDSQVINNVNLEKGILLGNLNVGEKKTIIYKVKYINTSNSLTIINTTKVNYDYKKFNGLIFEGNEVENQLEINSTISNFKCIYKTEKIYREKCKPCIEGVNSISADIDILEYHLVKTIEGKSNEGQKLTGYKIVLEGLIKEVIEYSSVEDDGLVYAISEDIPFSTFIILPSNFKVGSKITNDYVIEELDFKKRDKNSIYTNICLLFIAKIQPCLGSWL